MYKRLVFLFVIVWAACANAVAQDLIKIHKTNSGTSWTMPLALDNLAEFDFANGGKTFTCEMQGDEKSIKILLTPQQLDSITFSSAISDAEKGHDKYRVFSLFIDTEAQAPVAVKEDWIDCHFSLDGKGEYSDFSGTGRIRGRGNSTWEWYDKKPYKIKLDSKSKLLGLDKAKNWNLLANYRDVGDLMNAYAFEAARCLGMPFTNHTRFVEVFLNGEYIGLYQLTEKIEVGKNRVSISEEKGWLMSLDLDDGPSLSPGATNNFSSNTYGLPVAVKNPEEPSAELLDSIRNDFDKLERAIKARNFHIVDSLLDVKSFIGILQLHEYLYNVEIDAPRSLYLFKDEQGKYTFGPVWDWDAGYDFDWYDMYTGHTFFGNYNKLMYGTDPAKQGGAAYRINKFFTDMFSDETFVAQYKKQWSEVCDTIHSYCWGEMEKYLANLRLGPYDREFAKWPIANKRVDTELRKMNDWLTGRLAYVNKVVANYPSGTTAGETESGDLKVVGTIECSKRMEYNREYSQNGTIDIDSRLVEDYLGGTPSELVPLNSDGEEGHNTAAGKYGAWFDSDGNTADYSAAEVHVYIESSNLYSWNYGCRKSSGWNRYCNRGDRHTVTMQYRLGSKAVNVKVTFSIE